MVVYKDQYPWSDSFYIGLYFFILLVSVNKLYMAVEADLKWIECAIVFKNEKKQKKIVKSQFLKK